MNLYPAIDLKDGKAVRLMHGRFDQVTEYDNEPTARLAAFVREGARWVHIVDLDGAQAGEAVQHAQIGAMAGQGARLQSGGGVRSADDVERLLGLGVERVVIGSLAVTATSTVRDWLEAHGRERIVLALDVKLDPNGVPRPAVKGWTETTATDLWAVLKAYPAGTATHVLVTDVGRDGALTGPNLGLLAEIVRRRPDLKLQASGGVASLDDLRACRDIGCDGAIIGRALYEGRFTLSQALEAVA